MIKLEGCVKNEFTQILKVGSHELDAQRHVNYAVYLGYLEYARVAAMELLGIPFQDCLLRGKGIVIVEAHIKYLRPATLGDESEITRESKPRPMDEEFRQAFF